MSSMPDQLSKQYDRNDTLKSSRDLDVFDPSEDHNDDSEDKQQAALVGWMNGLLPSLHLPVKASTEELRSHLLDGTVLLQILSRLKPGFRNEGSDTCHSSGSENIKMFLESMDELGVPRFDITDLEKGSMETVLDCLSTLRGKFLCPVDRFSSFRVITRCRSNGDLSSFELCSPTFGQRRVLSPESTFRQALQNPHVLEPSASLMHHLGHKFHEVFQLKQGRYIDLSAAKISEMLKSNSLDNAPTQSLLGVVNGILDETIERRNGEIPQRVACLLRKVAQEIERRISTQAEHIRTQNNLFKAREEKYYSRIRVLETLASGTLEESKTVKDNSEQPKVEKVNTEEKRNVNEVEMNNIMKEREQKDLELEALRKELEISKKTHELHCLKMETEAKNTKALLEERLKELEGLLEDSRKNMEVLKTSTDSKQQGWIEKEKVLARFVTRKFGALRELRSSSDSIKHELQTIKDNYMEEFHQLGLKIKTLVDATENYRLILAENRKMFNELQDLKGNIRVYCRVRPFLPGQASKQTTIEHIGEDGELVITNHSKPGKDGLRLFRFNKVYGPNATQAEVFSDTQPLIRSVLDGYNVCIFAYGQTGSGKTYTMTGPNGASEEKWGVNYRALYDLFNISKSRSNSFIYEVGVQMVEIHNEQVRDLLTTDAAQKKLGIVFNSQVNGIAVPDASMHPVTSTSDVLELMSIGLHNRAVGATAMNERSSRSHSVVSIHVRGKDLHTGSNLYGNLHLVDLAGSERVDRSEVTGDRLKEAQHINKSLSALGDVIFALAQKSSHIPYRNSKLTQLLQSSLGGQAKTLMFVQLNPDVTSYSETLSTLKFAERVSGVELGAARSSKEGRDVRDLMEQMASLKDTITKKDEEIERLQLLKDVKNVNSDLYTKKHGTGVHKTGQAFTSNDAASTTSVRSHKVSVAKAADEQDVSSDDQEIDSQLTVNDYKQQQNGFLHHSKLPGRETDQAIQSAGLEHDKSADEGARTSDNTEKRKIVSKIRSQQRSGPSTTNTISSSRDIPKGPISARKASTGGSSPSKPPRRWQ